MADHGGASQWGRESNPRRTVDESHVAPSHQSNPTMWKRYSVVKRGARESNPPVLIGSQVPKPLGQHPKPVAVLATRRALTALLSIGSDPMLVVPEGFEPSSPP